MMFWLLLTIGFLIFVAACVRLFNRYPRLGERPATGKTIAEHEAFIRTLPERYRPLVADENTVCVNCGERGHFECFPD